MNPSLFFVIAMALTLAGGSLARAGQQIWYVTSPDHGQTYAYGSETNHSWTIGGSNNHLALNATYSNGPWAQGSNVLYDNFIFNFPQVKLGSGGHTFFYHASNGLNLPVARRQSGFLGITQIKLLPTAYLVTKKKHGFLTQTLVIGVAPFEENPNTEINFAH
jgi:hypothetical protein